MNCQCVHVICSLVGIDHWMIPMLEGTEKQIYGKLTLDIGLLGV
jgi:hypothetical protein